MDKTVGANAITTVMIKVQELVEEISKECLEIEEATKVPSFYIMKALLYALGFSAITVEFLEKEVESEE